MESGIQEAVISILNELAALIHKANQLLDVVIERERDERERGEMTSTLRRSPPRGNPRY